MNTPSKPITLKAEEIRELQQGAVTIRREIKWTDVPNGHDYDYEPYEFHDGVPMLNWNPGNGLGTQTPILCPFGPPGTVLWVRETWGGGEDSCTAIWVLWLIIGMIYGGISVNTAILEMR